MKAIEQGVARIKMSKEEIYKQAERTIRRAREETQLLMKEKFIAPVPEAELKKL
jgi:malate dehydrogenase (oxaloacetate-decarboxylating)